MRNLFFSRKAVILVDILMIVCLIIAGIYTDDGIIGEYWKSFHCITGLVWFSMAVIHVAQHWRMIKSFTRKKVIFRNRITALTLLSFIFMLLSILFFTTGFNASLLMFHHFAGRFFMLMFLIHTIHKSKRFIALFRR
ncbi:MAG: hypothetical protein LBC19_12025 [Tannerella sp.]|jgi:hypothetical protein|nr:hypothetical protein [Tannerella sp.]